MKCMIFCALFSLTLTMALYHIGYANNVWGISAFFKPITWNEQKRSIVTGMVIDPSSQPTGGIYRQLPTNLNLNILDSTDGVFTPPDKINFSLDALLKAYNVPLPTAILLFATGLIGFVGVHRSG